MRPRDVEGMDDDKLTGSIVELLQPLQTYESDGAPRLSKVTRSGLQRIFPKSSKALAVRVPARYGDEA